MIDVDCWNAIAQAFSVIDHTKRPQERGGDAFGELHVLLFGDFKQYIIFDRVGYSIRRNDSLYMESDQIGFFASRRGDGQVGLTAAFKIMKNA